MLRRAIRLLAGSCLLAAFLPGCGGEMEPERQSYAGRSEGNLYCPAEMALVPSGDFTFGPEKPGGKGERMPVRAFCIDRYEYPNRKGDPPLRSATWIEAANFCTQRGKRLCTEYEQERACRGPKSLLYPYGNQFAPGACPKADEDYRSGTYLGCASAFGVFDMSGGVWEWTSSETQGEAKDADEKILRGGMDADDPAGSSRCASRMHAPAKRSAHEIGFRCCRGPDKQF